MTFVYKIFETQNNYYLYIVSHIDDEELVLEHYEHYSANHFNIPKNKYFNLMGWDLIDIQKVNDVKAIDVINNTLPADEKCMNVSTSYEKLISEYEQKLQEKKKTPRGKNKKEETTDVQEKEKKPKKAPKPRGKKAGQKGIQINMGETVVDMN